MVITSQCLFFVHIVYLLHKAAGTPSASGLVVQQVGGRNASVLRAWLLPSRLHSSGSSVECFLQCVGDPEVAHNLLPMGNVLHGVVWISICFPIIGDPTGALLGEGVVQEHIEELGTFHPAPTPPPSFILFPVSSLCL